MSRHKDLRYLVRHGAAEDRHALGDDARALTAEGRAEFRRLAGELAAELPLVAIATSPLVRAVQTAEILAEACDVSDVSVRGELSLDGASAAGIERLLRELGPGWALVGHNPAMGEALGRLLGLPDVPSFRKGAIAALTLTPRPALAWVVAPGRKRQTTLD
jgi:phosphohistidine phosphatase